MLRKSMNALPKLELHPFIAKLEKRMEPDICYRQLAIFFLEQFKK